MYNKIFSKILDSSIWLEPTPTRIVWLTFIAAMDETGFVQFASVGNVAHRAIVTLEEAEAAIACLEGPDPQSADPEREGRRIERVPGGWIVLNAQKYRDLVTRLVAREQTRERVRKHRDRKRTSNGSETVGNDFVTQSEAEAEADTETNTRSFQDQDNQQQPDPLKMAAVTPNDVTTTPEPKPKKEKPIISGKALTIHRWMVEECEKVLGGYADDFGVLDWLWSLDERAWRDGLVMPKRDGGEWLQSELVAEAQRRGIPIRFATAPKTVSAWEAEVRARRQAGL